MNKNTNQSIILSGQTSTPVILSDSEGSLDSSAKAFRMTGESGRSMVEMLGVLAIIGVLSIGALHAFTLAMNKHKANEILNAASVRAMVISAKLQQDSTANVSNALAEFSGETVAGASFGNPEKGTGTFTLKLSNVSTDACTQIKSIVSDSSNVNINEDCSIFTYNNDLSAPVASGGNTDTPSGPSCPADTSTEGEGGYATTEGTGSEAIRCYCTESGSTYVEGSGCTGTTKTTACESFRDCDKGYFCDMTAKANSCTTKPSSGTCQPAVAKSATKGYQTLDLEESTTSWGGYMDWWTAMDFCDAIGSSPVGAFDHCTSTEETTIMDSSTNYPYGYCTSDTDGGWKDTSDGNYYWTKDLVIDVQKAKGLTETSEGSCRAFDVDTVHGYVYYSGRKDRYYALCE